MEDTDPDLVEEERGCPAARCRECGVITHECSITAGVWTEPYPEHRKGCSKPFGRLHLLEIVKDQAPELMEISFGKMLERRMESWELDLATTMLLGYLERRDD